MAQDRNGRHIIDRDQICCKLPHEPQRCQSDYNRESVLHILRKNTNSTQMIHQMKPLKCENRTEVIACRVFSVPGSLFARL